ncbi:MAG: hypothetical protein WAT29_05760 [Thiolinea sp.]
MNTLLSDNLWGEMADVGKSHIRLYAAISYVTASHLDFRKGDVLICDASDDAIKGGLTSASILRLFFSQGADLYSYNGLHSKVAVIDSQALIGSANLSNNAGVGTCEASLLTDDIQIIGLVHGFIENLRQQSIPIDEVFLKYIELLPVAPRVDIKRFNKNPIFVGKSRVWFIGTRELSNRILHAEQELVEQGRKEAEKRVKKENYSVWPIRYIGKSKFRLEAKPGDVVIEAFSETNGSEKETVVYRPVPILHRLDDSKCTYFYVENTPDDQCFDWLHIKSEFEHLGIFNITPNSTKELIGKALAILSLIEHQ